MKRKDILSRLKEIFSEITIANGYHSDIGNNVSIWEDEPENEKNLPFVNIRDRENRIERMGVNLLWNNTLEVEISIACSGDTPTEDMRNMIADIYQAIHIFSLLSEIVTIINPLSDTIDRDDYKPGFAYAEIKIEFKYQTLAWKTE